MRELYRPALPVARLLVVALGLLGFVAGPAGAGAHGGTSATGTSPTRTTTGTIIGVRTGAAQHTPARSRASTKPRPGRHAQAVIAAAVRSAEPAHPAHPSHAVLPPTGVDVRPPAGHAARSAAAPAAPDVPPEGVPRGRAPPSSTGI